MNTKNNQRYRDMDRRLKETLLELLKTTDFEKITVKRLCETACVNRTTFYAHYGDIYEMMGQMEEHLNRELLDSYPPGEPEGGGVFPAWPFVPFLQHIKKYRHFYRIALRQRREFPLAQGYEGMWNQIVRPKCEAAGITSQDEMMYYFVYFQAGLTMVLKRWVDTGCRESEDAMRQMIENCVPNIWKNQPIAASKSFPPGRKTPLLSSYSTSSSPK